MLTLCMQYVTATMNISEKIVIPYQNRPLLSRVSLPARFFFFFFFLNCDSDDMVGLDKGKLPFYLALKDLSPSYLYYHAWTYI